MKYVYKTNLSMFIQFAVNVMGVNGRFRDQESIALEGIDRLKEFYIKMGLPTTLNELRIDETNLEIMAKKATNFVNGNEIPIGGFKKLNWEDVLYIS